MTVEHTDTDELRFDAEPASADDAGVLAAWLAERGVEVLFRAESGALRIAGLRDLSREATEPAADPGPRFVVLVPDGRVRDGWRRTDRELTLGELAEFLSGTHGTEVRFQPTGQEQ